MSDSCTFLTCQNFALRQYPVFLRDFWRFSSETGWPLSKTSCPSMISMAPLRFCDKIWHRLYPFSPGTFPRGTLTVFCNTWQRRRATHTRVLVSTINTQFGTVFQLDISCNHGDRQQRLRRMMRWPELGGYKQIHATKPLTRAYDEFTTYVSCGW